MRDTLAIQGRTEVDNGNFGVGTGTGFITRARFARKAKSTSHRKVIEAILSRTWVARRLGRSERSFLNRDPLSDLGTEGQRLGVAVGHNQSFTLSLPSVKESHAKEHRRHDNNRHSRAGVVVGTIRDGYRDDEKCNQFRINR